jgi:molybdate transport system regulatory protein
LPARVWFAGLHWTTALSCRYLFRKIAVGGSWLQLAVVAPPPAPWFPRLMAAKRNTGEKGARRALTLRLALGEGVALGPGKAELLEGIRDAGSIAAAGRRMGMSYQRAHDLVVALNADFREQLVATAMGGTGGGGARLTSLGEEVLRAYREAEAAAETAVADRLVWLRSALARRD